MSKREQLLVKMLGEIFYDVVPLERATYCVKYSAICVRILKNFGVHAEIQNCQLWCLTNDQNYAIGFLGKPPTEGKWDGHAICRTKSFFIDCASYHFKTQFNIEVPHVIVGQTFQVASQIIARCDLSNDSHLLWLYPSTNESAESAGGAPSAPSCVGGVGEGSAHFGEMADKEPEIVGINNGI